MSQPRSNNPPLATLSQHRLLPLRESNSGEYATARLKDLQRGGIEMPRVGVLGNSNEYEAKEGLGSNNLNPSYQLRQSFLLQDISLVQTQPASSIRLLSSAIC